MMDRAIEFIRNGVALRVETDHKGRMVRVSVGGQVLIMTRDEFGRFVAECDELVNEVRDEK